MAGNKDPRFVSNNALLLKEWDFEKNSISPYEISYGSAKLCYWKCSVCGFEWKTPAYSRGSNGCGCPSCARKERGLTKKKSSALKNSFVSAFPQIAAEWHPTKNTGIEIENVSAFSNVKVWWKCATCGNEWETTVNHRTKEGNSCPLCSKKNGADKKAKTHAERNNFADKHPELIEEWHPFLNGNLTPFDVSEKSNKKIWWRCGFCGYEWKTMVNHRASGQGCPNCSKAQTSFAEQAVYYYVSQVYPDAIHRYNDTFEFDVYIPSRKTAIEYDGYFWHHDEKKLENDNKKDRFCMENGIFLIRLRAQNLKKTESAINIFCIERKLKESIEKLFLLLDEIPPDYIDVEKDALEIQQQFRQIYNEKSVAVRFPAISQEWHPWKNGKLKPFAVTAFSAQKIWWQCKACGYEWQDTPNHRCGRNSGCPLCASKVVVQGENDLATVHPLLAQEWHAEKNGNLLPTQVAAQSNKKVWWKCLKYGHEWQAVISERTRKGHSTNCPYCGNKKVLAGFNDLASVRSDLAAEWHTAKNEIMPTEVTVGSHKKVWWKCRVCQHEWQAAIYSRQTCGCPACARDHKTRRS